MAKTLPEDDGFRRHVGFAEQELAPGDIKIALDYVVSDNPDPSPWEDIYWMARAGRFDRAIKQAKQRKSPVERLGGLLAVAAHMLDKNDTARAKKIVEEVERQLPAKAGADDEYAGSLARDAGEIWARLGQTERAARLMGGAGVESVSALLAAASKYPAAASLREQAWREAERVNAFYAWRLLAEDAISRGDQAEASRAGQRASGAIDGNQPEQPIGLAQILLTAGLPDLSARLVKPWPQWVDGKEAISQSNIVRTLIPVLAGLRRDQEVETAASAVTNGHYRSECLSKAADAYFLLGRSDVAGKFDTEALAVAVASPAGEPKLQWAHDAAIHNLALVRADHGDIQGALAAVAELHDAAKIREVTSYVVRRAIDNGHGPVVRPALEALEQLAGAAQDAGLLLQAANGWYAAGSEENAQDTLSRAMKMAEQRQTPLVGNDLGDAAELMWRISGKGKAESIFAIVDQIGGNDPGAIDHLVEIIRPVSPAVAVQLTGRQVEVERRIGELANIAIQIAGDAK